MPDFSKWFTTCMANQAFVNVVGHIKPIEIAMKAFDPDAKPEPSSTKGGKKEGGKKKKDEKPVDPEDVELDLFGDDDDDGEAAKKAAEAAKAQKKKKEKPAEMSLIMMEVKPLDDTTDLDKLAERIFTEVKQDGLFWKTEFKKEPVAFGIFKLIIGFSCIDDKTSVDQVQEDIEAMNDMV